MLVAAHSACEDIVAAVAADLGPSQATSFIPLTSSLSTVAPGYKAGVGFDESSEEGPLRVWKGAWRWPQVRTPGTSLLESLS